MLSWLVIAIVLALWALSRALLRIVVVQGESMAPTLQAGERLLALRCWRGWTPGQGRLRRGQVGIIKPFAGESAAAEREYYIKRIAGLPGDICPGDGQQRAYWPVPPGHCFVQGDAEGSVDSRTWGPLPLTAVRGVVIMKLPRRARPNRPHAALPPLIGLPIGQPAPPFKGSGMDGAPLDSTRYAGRALLLLISAPTNGARETLPALLEGAARARSAGVEVLLVSLGTAEETSGLVSGLSIDLPILLAPREEHPLAGDYRIEGWPCFCLIDERGYVRSHGYPGPHVAEWRALEESWGHSQAEVGRR